MIPQAYNAANASEYVGDGEEVYTAEDFEHIADDATKWEAWDEEAAAYGVGYAAADEEGGYGDGFGEYDYYEGQDVAADPEAQLYESLLGGGVSWWFSCVVLLQQPTCHVKCRTRRSTGCFLRCPHRQACACKGGQCEECAPSRRGEAGVLGLA